MTVRINPDRDICDFCSDPNPIRVYAAADFMVEKTSHLPQVSEGAWSACRNCSDLINAEKWNELTHRAFEAILQRHHISIIDQPKMFRSMLELHARFRQHMRHDS